MVDLQFESGVSIPERRWGYISGVTEYTVDTLSDLSSYVDTVPSWVDSDREHFCKLKSHDYENNQLIFSVSKLCDIHSCQVIFIEEDSVGFIYLIPTTTDFTSV